MNFCPTDGQFSDFLADTLSTAQRDALARHVEGCPSCLDKLARLAWTPNEESWRRAAQPAQRPEAEERIVRRLKRMRPPSENNGLELTASAGDRTKSGDLMPGGVESECPAVSGYEMLGEL